MRLIGLAVALAVSLAFAPLAAETQPAGKVYRVGFLRAGPAPDTFVAGTRAVIRSSPPTVHR
jgi:hypothetical protein